jgi:hypothetical protein
MVLVSTLFGISKIPLKSSPDLTKLDQFGCARESKAAQMV